MYIKRLELNIVVLSFNFVVKLIGLRGF